MSDAQRRAIRSFAQVFVVQAGIQLWNAFADGPHDITAEQAAAITVFATPILSFVQNWLEDNTSAPALLKAPASSGQNPEPDHA